MRNTSEEPKPKIGAGHLSGMARLGLKELASALAPNSEVVQPAEIGVFGTLTQREIAEAKFSGLERDSEGEQESVLADRLRQAEARDVHGRDSKELIKE